MSNYERLCFFLAGILVGLAISLSFGTTAHAAEPLVIGHRGASTSTEVENTLESFQYAGRQGADMVELDVYWTADDIPVVSHDSTMDRMTNCTGLISEQTWAELRGCKINGTEETLVPLARAVTVARRGHFDLLIHMGPRKITDEQADTIVELTYRGRWAKRTLVQSFYHGTLRVVDRRDTQNRLRIVVLTSKNLPTVAYVKKYHAKTVAVPFWNLTRTQVQAYQKAGLKVFVWTTVSEKDQLYTLRLHPDGIITDNTHELETILKNREK